jgi:hypothetical protein
MPQQEATPREQHAQTRAGDRVQADKRLVGQESQGQKRKQQWAAGRFAGLAQLRQPTPIPGLAHEFEQGSRQHGQKDHPHDQQRPEPSRPGPKEPARDQQGARRRRDEAAAQVVAQLPLRQGRQRIGLSPRFSPSFRRARHARHKPTGQLPVAPYPAVSPADVHGIADRMLLDEVHVGHQGGAG